MDEDERYTVPVLLDTEEAAKVLRVSVRTMEGWRCAGLGPKFVKFGKGRQANVMYRVTALNDWLDENTTDTRPGRKGP